MDLRVQQEQLVVLVLLDLKVFKDPQDQQVLQEVLGLQVQQEQPRQLQAPLDLKVLKGRQGLLALLQQLQALQGHKEYKALQDQQGLLVQLLQ